MFPARHTGLPSGKTDKEILVLSKFPLWSSGLFPAEDYPGTGKAVRRPYLQGTSIKGEPVIFTCDGKRLGQPPRAAAEQSQVPESPVTVSSS